MLDDWMTGGLDDWMERVGYLLPSGTLATTHVLSLDRFDEKVYFLP